jgi:prolyl oligopeptidase
LGNLIGQFGETFVLQHPCNYEVKARMLEQGHKDVLYYENMEGGHGGAADNLQRAQLQALRFAFFWSALGGQ